MTEQYLTLDSTPPAHYQLAYKQNPKACLVISAHGGLVAINAQAERLLNLDVSRPREGLLKEIFPESIARALLTLYSAVIREQCLNTAILFIVSSKTWCECLGYPIHHDQVAVYLRDITMQEDSDDARLRCLQNHLCVAFTPLALIEDDRFLQVNSPFAALFGTSTQEFSGRLTTAFVAEEYRDTVTRHIHYDTLGTCEFQAYRMDGSLFIGEMQGSTIRVYGRKIYLAAIQDLTTTKAAELLTEHHFNEVEHLSQTALQFLEGMPIDALHAFICEQIASLAGNAIVAVGTYNAVQQNIMLQSVVGHETALQILDGILGDSLKGRVLAIDPNALRQISNGELQKLHGGVYSLFFGNYPVALCKTVENQLNIKAVYHQPLFIAGKLLGIIFIAMQEQVTPQNPYLVTAFVNQASMALQRYLVEGELEREQAYLAAAIDMLPLPLAIITPDKQVQQRNRAMQTLLDSVEVSHEFELAYLDLVTKVPVLPEYHPYAKALKGISSHGDEMVLLIGEKEISVLVYAAPVYLDGKIVAIVYAVEDVSVLKEADKNKDEFLTVLSHELKTPLTCILGWSEVAQYRDETVITRQALEIIHRNARRQQLMINELLDVSRIIYRRLVISPELLNLREEIVQAVENVEQEAHRRNISLSVMPPKTSLFVQADRTRLQQCFSNLLQNSFKFTPAGGSITFSCIADGNWAVIKVHDTGRGISKDLLEKLFMPFVQARRDEVEGGLGLGLALVHGIIALHNGTITAESPGEGQGSTFTIRLQLVQEIDTSL